MKYLIIFLLLITIALSGCASINSIVEHRIHVEQVVDDTIKGQVPDKIKSKIFESLRGHLRDENLLWSESNGEYNYYIVVHILHLDEAGVISSLFNGVSEYELRFDLYSKYNEKISDKIIKDKPKASLIQYSIKQSCKSAMDHIKHTLAGPP